MIEQPVTSFNLFSSKENMMEVMRRIRHQRRTNINPRSKFTVNRQQYNNYYKFTFVRNPWARAYSWYRNIMRDKMHRQAHHIDKHIPFNEFLRDHLGKGGLRPQTYWIKDAAGAIPLDYVGKFERLENDFEMICKAMNLSPIPLAHTMKGSSCDYRNHYDRASINRVANFYQEEIKMFDYTFES